MIPSLDPPPAAQALADTLVTVQAQNPLGVVADIAVIVMALALTATFVALFLFLRRLSGLERKLLRAGRRTAERAGPLLERGGEVADNLEFITRALRTDVERLNASVKALTDRLGQASDRMEERVEEFNALMEVVQAEAEAIFIDTASTVRGVQAGARSLRRPDGRRPSGGSDHPGDGHPEDGGSDDTRPEHAAPSARSAAEAGRESRQAPEAVPGGKRTRELQQEAEHDPS